METDYAEPTAGREQLDRLRQRGLDRLELGVYAHAYGLEAARGRMLARLARGHRGGDHRRELAGAFDRRFGPRGDDGARDASRELFLAQPVQRVRELALRGAREPLGCGLTGLVVHPHVERPVLHETEAAIGFVELRR